jgi:capsular polysaccharide biosynthesis protein
MEQRNDLVRLLQIIYKWKKPIIITTVIVAIGTAIVTLFMPNYYKSSVNFYPSNPIMTDRQVLYSQIAGEIEIDYFGTASDVDRILTIANTSSLIDYVINHFHLMEHYGIDSTKEMARYNCKKKFLSNYSAVETEYGAIDISVWDKNKDTAMVIANHIVETIDQHNKNLIMRDKKMVVKTFKNQVEQKEKIVTNLTDSVSAARKAGASPEQLIVLDARLQSAVDDLNLNRKLLEQNETAVNTDFSTVHITEAAYPALRKDKPVRSLIVIGVTLATLVFMILLAVITENYKKIKSRLQNA